MVPSRPVFFSSGTPMVLQHTYDDGNDVSFIAAMFRDGFETSPGDNLTMPDAEEVLR